MKIRTFLLIAIATLSFQQVKASDTSVTCTKNNRIIYQDTISGKPTTEQKMFVYAKNPDAMCIFMNDGNSHSTPSEPVNPLTENVPEAITNGNAAGSDLAAALARISSGNTGTPYPIDITKEVANFKKEANSEPVQPHVEHTINVTIGIYKSVPIDDVMAHWKEMQLVGNTLKGMTPTVTRINEITMLSLENVLISRQNKYAKKPHRLEAAASPTISLLRAAVSR